MSTESTPVQSQIDNLKLKQVMRQSCLNFGAVDTARRIKHSPEKLDVLFDMLVSEDMVESAYLLAKSFLSEEAFEAFVSRDEYQSHFASIDKEGLKVSKVKNELHEKLTGETYDETRKRERAERKQANKETEGNRKSSAKEDGNEGRSQRAPKSTKESKRTNPTDSRKSKKDSPNSKPDQAAGQTEKRVRKVREAPTESPQGLKYLTLEEFGFTRENYFLVKSLRSFDKIKEHFLEQSVIGIDTQFQKGVVQAVSIASEDKVAVFDLSSLREEEQIIEYLKEILQSEKIEKIAHSFKLDAYYLAQLLGIEGDSIKNVIDLSANIVEQDEESTRKMGLNKMTEKFLKKSLNQYYKKSNWSERPLEQALIDFVALNGFIVIRLFLDYSKNQDNADTTYFVYEEPTNLPEFKEGESNRRRARSENKTSKNPKRGNEDRSRKRRPYPNKSANEEEAVHQRGNKSESGNAPYKRTRFAKANPDQENQERPSEGRNRTGGSGRGPRRTDRPYTNTKERAHDEANGGERESRPRVRGRGGREGGRDRRQE